MTTLLFSVSWNDSTTTESDMNTTERPLESYPLYIAANYSWKICVPFIFLFGLFGNVMTIIIMRRTASGDSVIQIYFMATAVIDTVYLCTVTLGFWMLEAFAFNIFATHTAVCKVFSWLYTGGSTISAWCLVCMTVHRAVSVVWPHRVNVLCTRRTVLLVLTGNAVALYLLYSHYMIGFGRYFVDSTKTYECTVGMHDENYVYFFVHIFVYIELLVYSLLPFAVLALSNIVLVWKLSVSVKAVNRKLPQTDSEQVDSRAKAANSVTLTVIVVSLAFVALTLPDSIRFLLYFFSINHSALSGYEFAKATFISKVCFLVNQINFAVNFYLYILTGRRFREEFLKVMRNKRRRGADQ